MRERTYDLDQEIQEVLKHYDLLPLEIEMVRSAYRISCENKSYCLKKLRHGKTKSSKGEAIVRHLKKNGFPYVADYIKTREGSLYVKLNRHTYYLTEWIEGQEADFKELQNLLKAIKHLALFHRASIGFEGEIPKQIKDCFVQSQHNNQKAKEALLAYKEEISNKETVAPWEKKYMEYIDVFIKKADQSMNLFKRYNYEGIIKKDIALKGFCHESYYYQNIIVDHNEDYYMIDLDSCARNIFVYDLGKFLRRMLWSREYEWDFEVVRRCIETYKTIRPLEKVELGVLLGIIIFPHKYWRLGSKRWEKNELWSEEKYHKKLERQIFYLSSMESFIREYAYHYGINMGG